MEPFRLIYADPAHGYRDEAKAGERGAASKYPTQSPLQNVAYIDQHAADHCTLFCWLTFPTQFEVYPALIAAGFKFRTLGFLWVKTTQDGEALHWGMGHWSRSNPEPCYIFTRGSKYPRPRAHNVHSTVFAPVGEHSAKPPEVRDRIVQMMGDRRRAELFARERVDGWESFGLEVDGRLP